MRPFFYLLAPTVVALLACTLVVPRGTFRRFWEKWLVVDVPMHRADALIVLGGEPQARPGRAARLYIEGKAPVVFVTGRGDSEANRRLLIADGVPASCIVTESNAASTYQNALFLKPILKARGVRSAILVTSPFHTRRALGTFRKVVPDVNFGITSASIPWWGRPEGQSDVNRFAAVEFLKTAEYWTLYGIPPFARFFDSHLISQSNRILYPPSSSEYPPVKASP